MTDQPPIEHQHPLPFGDVVGPAPATGHLGPQLAVGVGVAITQGGAFAGIDLDRMEHHCPGASGRILAMAEAAQTAQIAAGTRAQDYARDDTQRGQWMGASLTALAVLGAIAEGIWGNPWVAGAIVGVPVFAAIGKVVDAARK